MMLWLVVIILFCGILAVAPAILSARISRGEGL